MTINKNRVGVNTQAQLALSIMDAINNVLAIQAGPLGIGDNEIYGTALRCAEGLAEQFDILPKGELKPETRTREFPNWTTEHWPLKRVNETRMVTEWREDTA